MDLRRLVAIGTALVLAHCTNGTATVPVTVASVGTADHEGADGVEFGLQSAQSAQPVPMVSVQPLAMAEQSRLTGRLQRNGSLLVLQGNSMLTTPRCSVV